MLERFRDAKALREWALYKEREAAKAVCCSECGTAGCALCRELKLLEGQKGLSELVL